MHQFATRLRDSRFDSGDGETDVTQSENPYSPPTFGFELVPSSEPRQVSSGAQLLVGAILGAASFLVAMAFIPASVDSPMTYDLILANNLGFIYPPLLGLWAGWVRRSMFWGIFGCFAGLLIGLAYYALCGTDFLAVMVVFPCLLGGATSVLLGTKHDSWLNGIAERFIWGLIAGFVLGFTYMFALMITYPFFSPIIARGKTISDHSTGMWFAGTFAMTLSSALYLLLFHWSAGLNDHRRHETTNTNEPTSPEILSKENPPHPPGIS